MYEYNANLVKVTDGDTIVVDIDFGFNLRQKKILRLADVDAEELRSSDPEKRIMALAAKRFVQEILEDKRITIKTLKTKSGRERETFGRIVATVYFTDNEGKGNCLNNLLVSEGFAKEWV
jgi:endonuclease YncB( thermonuclease family)